MMRFARSAVLLAAAVAILGARQEASVVDKIIDEGRNRSEVQDILFHLTNGIGPRLTSSDRLTRACGWARHKFESWGLKNCRLEQWGTFDVGFNRGPATGKMIAPEELDLMFATNTWTPGTKGAVEGPAIVGPKSEEELAAIEPKLKGAWVLSPGVGIPREITEKILAAYDKAGIAGLIGRSQRDNLTIMGRPAKWDALPTRVNVVLKREHFDQVKMHVEAGKDVKLRFDIRNEFTKGPIPLYNVIAEIPGTGKPDELVIVGGHIDSWDGAQGTTDNGTGTSTTMEAARLLMKAGAKPKRTIRFMLWSGEEQGLMGSQAFVKAHPEETPKISAVLVHDGGTNYVSGIQAPRALVPIFEKVFEPVMKLDEKMPFEIQEVQGIPRGGASDHASYCAVGVPGFFWNQAGKADYGRTWHTWYDTFDAAVPEYQRHTSMVVAIAALNIANLDELLPRKGIFSEGGGNRRLLGVSAREDGVTVDSVSEDSAAERTGLKPGDKIIKLGDVDVKTNAALTSAIQKADRKTSVTVMRDGKEVKLPVVWDRSLGFRVNAEMIVSRVSPESAAEKAGLKEGDKVLKLYGKEVTDPRKVRDLARDGDAKANFQILRDGKLHEITIDLGP
jgi:carboxypeptidase Q